MEEYYNLIGIGFTNSKKQICTEKTEKWSDITFLKREFKYDNRFRKIVCPLDLNTVCGSLNWCSKKKDIDVVMSDKLNAFQREAYLHDNYGILMDQVLTFLGKKEIHHEFLSLNNLKELVERADCDFYMKNYQTFEEN